MVWFKVDDGLPVSRKVLSIPKRRRAAAIGVWTLAGCWAARELTDGFIPDYALAEIPSGPQYAPDLAAAGMWTRVFKGARDIPDASPSDARDIPDVSPIDPRRFPDDGYRFHDWKEYQRDREDVIKDRKDHAARQKAYRERMKAKRKAERDADSDASRDAAVTAASVTTARPDPTRPVPDVVSSYEENAYLSNASENERRSKPVKPEAARLARIYCDRVKLSNFGHVATTVGIGLTAGYPAAKIAPALEKLASEGRSVTENTLRIAIEEADKPDQSGSTRFYKNAAGMSFEVY